MSRSCELQGKHATRKVSPRRGQPEKPFVLRVNVRGSVSGEVCGSGGFEEGNSDASSFHPSEQARREPRSDFAWAFGRAEALARGDSDLGLRPRLVYCAPLAPYGGAEVRPFKTNLRRSDIALAFGRAEALARGDSDLGLRPRLVYCAPLALYGGDEVRPFKTNLRRS